MGTGRLCLAAALEICLLSFLLQVAQADISQPLFFHGRAVPVKRAHILNIVLSELAVGDVAWNYKRKDANKALSMDFLDSLMAAGIKFDRYYTHPEPAESLAALNTGMYPYKLALRDMYGGFSLPLTHKILPEYLREINYNTHLVGYWGLGFGDKDHKPWNRGYDTFYGYLGNFDAGWDDFWNGTEKMEVEYKTGLFTDRVVSIIQNHKKANDFRPLYIHLAHPALTKRMQSSEDNDCEDKCEDIDTGDESDEWKQKRRSRCEMACAVDKGVQKIMEQLEAAGYDKNLLVIFSGASSGTYENGASYLDLRGWEGTVYEAGVRVPAFVYSKTLLGNLTQKKQHTHKWVAHITDWVPTLLSAAQQCKKRMPKDLDGMDLWQGILTGKGRKQEPFVYSINTESGEGAVGMKRFKLVRRQDGTTNCPGWMPGNTHQSCDQWELYKITKRNPEQKKMNNEKTMEKMKIVYEAFAAKAARSDMPEN